MKCDVRILDEGLGNIQCSVLAETQAAHWVVDEPSFRDKLRTPRECDAVVVRKKSLLGEKVFFRCHVMGEFTVSRDIEGLQMRIRKCQED
jgi:hypothetical protein